MKTEYRLKALLEDSGLKISTAESCSGGMIAHLITSVPGASAYFAGSVVSYSPEVKKKILGVPEDVIEKYGIVSKEVAAAMAEGVAATLGTDYSVAITGWADIYGDSHEPAGTAWIGVSGPEGTRTYRVKSLRETPAENAGSQEKLAYRKANIRHFSTLALEKLLKYIETC